MWKIIILSTFLVAVNTEKPSIDEFVGQWTPVALYPAVPLKPLCLRLSLFKQSGNEKCTCDDGQKTEFVGSRQVINGAEQAKDTITIPMLVIDNNNDLTPSVNVNCTCNGKDYSERVVVKLVNENYLVVYKFQSFHPTDPNAAIIYARNTPKFEELIKFMKTITDLKTRDGVVLCCQEYESTESDQEKVKQVNKLARSLIL